ncbi:branched-chain amino acid transport system II carrier protein [Schnuerera ultunensis]
MSAVGLPILAIVAVFKAGGFHILASRVHPKFTFAFTVLIYLSIGPFLSIPRAASLAFEMGISPFLSKGVFVSPIGDYAEFPLLKGFEQKYIMESE